MSGRYLRKLSKILISFIVSSNQRILKCFSFGSLYFKKVFLQFTESNYTWCKNLNFDKTKNLFGYEIRMGLGFNEYRSMLKDPTQAGFNQYLGSIGLMNLMIWKQLNATVKIKMYPETCLYHHENNKACSIFKDVIIGRIDYIVNSLFRYSYWKHFTIPIKSTGICAVALMNENTAAHKFMLTFTNKFWLIIISSILASTIGLKYLLKRSMISSFLEILRMLLSMSSLRQPQQSVQRILFAILIFLTMMLNSYFQSRMSAMHIVPNSDPTIDSREDLEKSDLLVYGKKDNKEFFQDSAINSRYVDENNYTNCIELLTRGERVSCLFSCLLRDRINKSPDMHVAKYMIKEIFGVMYTRQDWPLKLKFDRTIRKMHEAGITKFHEDIEKRVFEKRDPNHEEYASLSIEEMSIAFYVLVGGFVAAIGVLIAEITICKK